MRKIIILSLLLFFCLPAISQQDLYHWKIKGYAGVAHYYNADADAAEYAKFDDNNIYRLEIGKTLSNTFGLSLSSTFGKIKGLDYEKNPFQTEARMGSLRLYFYMDNGWLLNSSATIAPYLYGGYGLSVLETNYGLLSIESSSNSVFPFGAGFKFRISERVNFEVHGEAVYGDNNHLAVQELEQNEYNSLYFHAGVALAYNFGFKKTTFTAPRFYAGDVPQALINDSVVKPTKNMVETILKVEPKESSKPIIVKVDSVQLSKIEATLNEPKKKKKQTKEVIPSDSIQLKVATETVEVITETTDTTFEDKIIVKDSIVTMERNVVLPDSLVSPVDSLVSDTVRTRKLEKLAKDTVFVITDSTKVTLLDSTLRVVPGDTVVRKVTKFKTAAGRDSVVVKETITRAIKDTTIIKNVPVIKTVRDTVRVIKQIEPDINKVERDTVVINNYVRDTVYIEKDWTPEEEVEQVVESPERTPVERWEYEPQREEYSEERYTPERNDDYRYEQPKVTSTYEKSVIEKTIYIPQDISGGYIIGVKPDSPERKPDTLKYDVVKSYFDSLSIQNRALMNMVDSLQRVVAGDSLKKKDTPSSVIYYTPTDKSSGESNQLLLDYIDKQAAYNDQMRVKFDTMESELARIQLANATLNMETKKAAELKALNDSIARLNKLLVKPVPEVKKPVTFPETTVYFKTGSNGVPPENYNEIKQIVDVVKADPALKVQLAGHSDLSGNPNSNLILSRKRAESVSLHFQKLGIPKSRILIQYFGDTKAIEKANPLDRKVEVKIINK